MYKIFNLVILSIFFTFSTQVKANSKSYKNDYQAKPKNVILLIGDGMGLAQITYGILRNPNQSNFKRFKNIGLINTSSASEEITDSAAGATAFATGYKTYNGAISVNAKKESLTTILEIAKNNNLSTGLVTTCSIVHATPAAFVAHQPFRDLYEKIAEDFLESNLDIFIGGGLKYFKHRKDKKNLLQNLQDKGYKIYTDEQNFFLDDYVGKTAALLALDHIEKIQNNRKDYAEKSLMKALKVLSQNKKGFFLMVEGSQIDWGGHYNDAEYIKSEIIDFDHVIGRALDFAEQDKNTLVIVTADHETGGFALTGKNNFKTENYGSIIPKFTSYGHSATMVPVFAYGFGAEEFTGIYENTEIFWKIKKLLKI